MQAQQVLISLKTVSEMMADRGYPNKIYDKYDENMININLQNNFFIEQVGIYLICYMMKQNKPKISDINQIIKDNVDNYQKFIFITNKSIATSKTDNDNIKKTIAEYSDKKIQIQNFTLAQLQYNIMKHQFQPPQEPIRDEEEIKQIMKEENISHRSEFCQIHQSDPVAQYFDLQLGQLVKITRHGTTIVYRYCIP